MCYLSVVLKDKIKQAWYIESKYNDSSLLVPGRENVLIQCWKKRAFVNWGASASAACDGGTCCVAYLSYAIVCFIYYRYRYCRDQGTMKMPVLIWCLIVAAIHSHSRAMFFPRIHLLVHQSMHGRGCVRKYFSIYTRKFGDSIVLKCCILTISISLQFSVICNTRSKSNG